MSYIKSLKSIRKELANEASQEPAAPEAPVSRGFASRSAMPAPQAPQELRYDPSLYVKNAMRRIQESRVAFSERTAEAAKKAMEKAPEKADKASPIAAITQAVLEDAPKPILDKDGSRPGMADREGGVSSSKGAVQDLHVDVSAFARDGVDILAMSQSVKDIESGGGHYQARGPVVEKGRYAGERALGAYQVMPGNLPSWSKAALGREVSEEEFLADPAIQDTIFLDQMTKSIDRYGTAEDAVSVWFTGRPVAKAGNATDGYTTASGYNAKYTAGYNKRTRT
jgi:hypothetical protein